MLSEEETPLYAYIRPNKLGEPHILVLSYAVRQALNWEKGKTRLGYEVDFENERIVLAEDPYGLQLYDNNFVYIGRRWDEFANRKQLLSGDFAVEINSGTAVLYPYRRVRGLRQSRGRPRDVVPLKYTADRGASLRLRGVGKEAFIEMLALAAIAIGENAYIHTALMERRHELLELLPAEVSYRNRFGTWERAVAYAKFREARLHEAGVDPEEAEVRLRELAEGAGI